VVRPLPDYETLELADAGDAIEADVVSVEGLETADLLLARFASSFLPRGGSARDPVLLIPRSEMLMFVNGGFELHGWLTDPRYLYALLHGVGCRLIALLLFGTKPRDEEERAIFRDVVVETAEWSGGRGPGKVWLERIVLLGRVYHLDRLADFGEERVRSDPLLRASFRFWTEQKLLKEAALIAAAATMVNPMRDGTVWLPPLLRAGLFTFLRVEREAMERWVRDVEVVRELAERLGLPFEEWEPESLPVDGETAYRAMRALEEAVCARVGARPGLTSPEHLLPALYNISKCFSVFVGAWSFGR
jgi:hypothetical protein